MKSYRQKRLLVSIISAVLLLGVSGCGFADESVKGTSGEIETQSENEVDTAAIEGGQDIPETGQIDKSVEELDEEGTEDNSEELTIEIEEEPETAAAEETQEPVAEQNPKDIDLIFFMGQSNMSGCGGDYTQAPLVTPGAGYEFRAVSDPFNLHDITEPFGFAESVVGGIWDVPGAKRGSLVSSFINTYHEKTGRCVIAVSASAGGTTTENWLSPGFVTDISVRLKNTQDYLNNNGYTVKNQYVIWLQGESDALHKTTYDGYKTNMDDIIRPLFIGGFTKVFIITPGQINTNAHFFDNIIDCQINMCKTSGYYALATTSLCAVSPKYMVDEWHYNQKVLNLIGQEAAEAVAFYTNEGKEMCIYDYKNDTTFIPDFFGYEENVTALKKDINGILAQQ